jgi:DNA-binding CsgD family transcriptional regulator
MRDDISNTSLNRELVLRLLRLSAKDRATSQRWSLNALVLISVFFVIVIVLDLLRVDIWLVVIVTILGLVILWVFSWFKYRNLENKFYQQELQEYENILHSENQKDFTGEQPAKPLEISLTPREVDILLQIADGKINKEIARALFLSESTVKNEVSRILLKLNAKSRTTAVVLALSKGLIKKDINIK